MDQTQAFRLAFGDSDALGEASSPEREAALAWLRQQPKLHDAWLTGLSYSDHAPADVLCRLLNRRPDSTGRRDRFWLTDRKLPQQVYESAARHPDRHVHGSVAENPDFPMDAHRHASDAEPRWRSIENQIEKVLPPGRRVPDVSTIFISTSLNGARRRRARYRTLPVDAARTGIGHHRLMLRCPSRSEVICQPMGSRLHSVNATTIGFGCNRVPAIGNGRYARWVDRDRKRGVRAARGLQIGVGVDDSRLRQERVNRALLRWA